MSGGRFRRLLVEHLGIADCGRREAQVGTDLAKSPTLGVQVGRTLNVHERSPYSLMAVRTAYA
jgi:hypothetical protein